MELFVRSDDGSLPELVLTFPEASGVSQTITELMKMSSSDLPDQIIIWKADGSGGEQMDLVSAARAVSEGNFEAFHIVLENLGLDGVSLPDLGVFIDPREITIDYRQGDVWNAQNIAALLKWMGNTGGAISAPWWRSEFPGIDAILSKLAAS